MREALHNIWVICRNLFLLCDIAFASVTVMFTGSWMAIGGWLGLILISGAIMSDDE